MKQNNIDVDKLKEVINEVKGDLEKAKRVNKIEGEWNLGEGPQFLSEMSFEKGKVTLKADQPSFMGGGGTQPGPMHYCLFGLASCYTATFVTMASMEGVKLKKVRVSAEGKMDFSRVFGLSNNPITGGIKITLFVESDAPEKELKRIEALAYERCPAVYCLTNAIKLETGLTIERK